jgi:hypothetical protein
MRLQQRDLTDEWGQANKRDIVCWGNWIDDEKYLCGERRFAATRIKQKQPTLSRRLDVENNGTRKRS